MKPRCWKKLLELQPTTKEQVEQKGYELERQQTNTKSILPSQTDVNAVKSDYRKQKEAAMSPANRSGKRNHKPLPTDLVGKCLACASTQHSTRECKTRDKEYCSSCKTTKHNDLACLKQAWARVNANKPDNKTSTSVSTLSTAMGNLTVQDSNPSLFEGVFQTQE